ncbi:MAG: transposase [archaeon]|nr:transposase [archaeon]
MTNGMYTAVRLTLDPNRAQKEFFDMMIGKLRYVYNACIYYLKHTYIHQDGRICSQFDLNRFCGDMWRRNMWLHTIYNNCMFETAARAKQAFEKCRDNSKKRKRDSGCRQFPRYRRLGQFTSFGYLSKTGFRIYDADDNGKLKRYVEMGKMPGRVRGRNMQEIIGTPKTLRIHVKDYGTHKAYYCSSSIELPEGYGEGIFDIEELLGLKERVPIGIDLGLGHVAFFSDGTVFDNPHTFAKEIEEFRKLSRKLTESKGTPREAKARSKMVHKYERNNNIKTELKNSIVNRAVYDHDLVFIEDLSLGQMRARAKGKAMIHSYNDASLGKIIDGLCRKSQKTQCSVVKVDPRNTSQLCSGCGAMVRKDLRERVHRCPKCGFTADRDFNASLNIRDRGLAGNPSSAIKGRITEPIVLA